ncbi:hypothetical protein ABID26_003962 [Mesorhizobium shonense]|uniref:Uncharacterized protein n=1 Tax=Mesorhizobium shonense TaxID=1209948 RepID=A0ABV2HVJ4_9HYPH
MLEATSGPRVMQDLPEALLKSVRENHLEGCRLHPAVWGRVALDRLFALCIAISNCRELRRVGFPDYPESFISGHADLAGIVVSLSRPFAIQWGFNRLLGLCLLSHRPKS